MVCLKSESPVGLRGTGVGCRQLSQGGGCTGERLARLVPGGGVLFWPPQVPIFPGSAFAWLWPGWMGSSHKLLVMWPWTNHLRSLNVFLPLFKTTFQACPRLLGGSEEGGRRHAVSVYRGVTEALLPLSPSPGSKTTRPTTRSTRTTRSSSSPPWTLITR